MDPVARRQAVVSVIAVVGAIVALSHFLPWVETRPGVVELVDPVLSQFEARDLSVPTFALIYGGLALLVGIGQVYVHRWLNRTTPLTYPA